MCGGAEVCVDRTSAPPQGGRSLCGGLWVPVSVQEESQCTRSGRKMRQSTPGAEAEAGSR